MADVLVGADVDVDAVSVAGSDGVGVVTAFAAAAVRHHRRHPRHSCARRDGAAHGDDAARRLHRLPRRVVVVPITFEDVDYVILQTKPFTIIFIVIYYQSIGSIMVMHWYLYIIQLRIIIKMYTYNPSNIIYI